MPHHRSIFRQTAVENRRRLQQLVAAVASAAGLFCTAAPAAQAQTAPNACGDGKVILQNAYPTARPDVDQSSYLLGDHRLMLPSPDGGNVPAMVCKVWPAQDNLLLVAVPRMDAKESLEFDRVGDLDILVVDRESRTVQQRLTLPAAMSDDAVRITKLEFDTARYVLAPGIQAFGLRTTRESASRAAPFSDVSLHLFAMRDGASGPLRVVLENLSTSRSSGEWDTNCTGDFSERKAVLSMTTDVHNGFFDIRVTQTGKETKTVPAGKGKTGCKETESQTGKLQRTLTYDRKRYAVPDELKGM